MEFLLDTHALIWFMNADNRLTQSSKLIIQNSENKCYVSIASIWEIAIKISLNKLDLNGQFNEISETLTNNSFNFLPITIEHTQKIIDLDFHHRDPFDRLIIAQSIVENMPIITKDKIFLKYNVDVFWD